VEAEIKGRRKDRLPIDDYKAENPDYRLVTRANLAGRMVSRLRKHKSELTRRRRRGKVKVVDERITRLMAGFNQRVKELRQ
jgi:hypothetical protein